MTLQPSSDGNALADSTRSWLNDMASTSAAMTTAWQCALVSHLAQALRRLGCGGAVRYCLGRLGELPAPANTRLHTRTKHQHAHLCPSPAMGPNKGRPRHAPPQPSDYETDAPQAIDYPPPPPPGRSNEELNLSAIRRHYPDVISIHHVAPYAVLYAFSLETEQWEKVGVEGSLFICGQVPSPAGAERYGVVILNRRSMDNFYMEIVGPDGLEFTDEYIIMQGDQVYGLWIFCEPPPSSTANARAETVAKMQELAVSLAHAGDQRLVQHVC
jgi:hypothetical protein